MPRLQFLEMIYGLTAWIYFKDHGRAHVHIYKGNPKHHEAMMKVEISSWRILELSGFSESTANRVLRYLQQHEQEILEVWHEIQKK